MLEWEKGHYREWLRAKRIKLLSTNIAVLQESLKDMVAGSKARARRVAAIENKKRQLKYEKQAAKSR